MPSCKNALLRCCHALQNERPANAGRPQTPNKESGRLLLRIIFVITPVVQADRMSIGKGDAPP
jgi:hypothetical protein